jgi:hypothetical protein
VTTLVVAVTALGACGGPSAGAASSPPAVAALPSPGSVPLPGTPGQAVAAYWRMVDADDYAGLAAVSAPGAAAAIAAGGDDIAHVELLRVAGVRRAPRAARVEVDVRIVPAGEATPWGPAGPHTLFVDLAETPGGGWLVAGWGTSP